jgi:hypothetical protein
MATRDANNNAVAPDTISARAIGGILRVFDSGRAGSVPVWHAASA